MQFSETERESLFEAGGWRMMSFLAGAGDGHARGGHADGGGRGAEVQRDEMSIGYNEIEVGVGVDQGWFGTVLPEVLLWWMPSRL